jgi:hypothetical protein
MVGSVRVTENELFQECNVFFRMEILSLLVKIKAPFRPTADEKREVMEQPVSPRGPAWRIVV